MARKSLNKANHNTPSTKPVNSVIISGNQEIEKPTRNRINNHENSTFTSIDTSNSTPSTNLANNSVIISPLKDSEETTLNRTSNQKKFILLSSNDTSETEVEISPPQDIRTSPDNSNTKSQKEPTSQERPRNRSCIIVGDSHARNLSKYLSHSDTHKYSVHCHPGKSMTKLETNFIDNLHEEDCLVVMGGANDVFQTPWPQMEKYLLTLLKNASTKIYTIIMSIPLRYDAPSNNIHIKRLNTKLRLIVNAFKNTVFLDINKRLKRKDYAFDKTHLGERGKKIISNTLTNIINKNVFQQKNNSGLSKINHNKTKTKNAKETTSHTRKPRYVQYAANIHTHWKDKHNTRGIHSNSGYDKKLQKNKDEFSNQRGWTQQTHSHLRVSTLSCLRPLLSVSARGCL